MRKYQVNFHILDHGNKDLMQLILIAESLIEAGNKVIKRADSQGYSVRLKSVIEQNNSKPTFKEI